MACSRCGQRSGGVNAANYTVMTAKGNVVFISSNPTAAKAVARRYQGAKVLDGQGKEIKV